MNHGKHKPRNPQRPDVSLTANVNASELSFENTPDTNTQFENSPPNESAAGSDRVNLPDHVQAGVVYHDVQVDYRLASKIVDPDWDEADNDTAAEQSSGTYSE